MIAWKQCMGGNLHAGRAAKWATMLWHTQLTYRTV